MTFMTVEPISAEQLKNKSEYPECGALCVFEGLVRNHQHHRQVTKLEYQAYVPMAEKELARLVLEIEEEWPGTHVQVVHRMGELQIGDVAVAICVFSPHRAQAFQACQAMIDRIKQRVPIWKKEFYRDGQSEWKSCCHSK